MALLIQRLFTPFMGWFHSLTHMHLVDRKGENVLMRSGSPASYGFGGPFGLGTPSVETDTLRVHLLEALRSEMDGEAYAEWRGSSPEEEVELVDITLLSEAKESTIIEAEKQAFGQDLVLWPVQGVLAGTFAKACSQFKLHPDSCPETLQPGDMAEDAVKVLAEHFAEWDTDQLDARVEALRAKVLATGSERPRIIFFHCVCGCDRTGELAIAYSMRYLNQSLTEALAFSERVASRHLVYKKQVAAQWYCEALRARGLYHHTDCGNCTPFRCRDTGLLGRDPKKFCILAMAAVCPWCILAAACSYCLRRRRRSTVKDDLREALVS